MGRPFRYTLQQTSGAARAGVFTTPHGEIHTPAFMVVGTQAAVRAMMPEQLRGVGTEVLLANTYHLTLRPGEKLVAKLGGLHGFMRWEGPIVTDSGGFQVFSLPSKEISDRGVRFKNEVDGSTIELTPERSIEIQNQLGADIIMAFDECTPYPADEKLAGAGVRRTLSWVERCLRAHQCSNCSGSSREASTSTCARPVPAPWSRSTCPATPSAASPSARATNCSARSPP